MQKTLLRMLPKNGAECEEGGAEQVGIHVDELAGIGQLIAVGIYKAVQRILKDAFVE